MHDWRVGSNPIAKTSLYFPARRARAEWTKLGRPTKHQVNNSGLHKGMQHHETALLSAAKVIRCSRMFRRTHISLQPETPSPR